VASASFWDDSPECGFLSPSSASPINWVAEANTTAFPHFLTKEFHALPPRPGPDNLNTAASIDGYHSDNDKRLYIRSGMMLLQTATCAAHIVTAMWMLDTKPFSDEVSPDECESAPATSTC